MITPDYECKVRYVTFHGDTLGETLRKAADFVDTLRHMLDVTQFEVTYREDDSDDDVFCRLSFAAEVVR